MTDVLNEDLPWRNAGILMHHNSERIPRTLLRG